MKSGLIVVLFLFTCIFADGVSEMKRVGDITYELQMSNSFKRGDEIGGVLTVTNLAENELLILKPFTLGRWRVSVTGPQGGHYEYNGVKFKIAPLSMKMFIPLKALESQEFPFTLGNYLPQETFKKSEYDWHSVIPGEYCVGMKLVSAIDNLNSFNVQFKSISFTVTEE